MKYSKKSFVLINGFDRSGTSAISRTLGSHQETEIIMQPFNSGFIRRKMYEIFGQSASAEIDEATRFFRDLKNEKINNDLINSHWHYRYSSTEEFVPDKMHIIKTTINHFAQLWMKENFPEIDVWGIWRKPKEIVNSIMSNNFYGEWYENGIYSIRGAVESVQFLRNNYLQFMDFLDSDSKRVAFLLAVRTHFFLVYLDKDKLIDYGSFRMDANRSLDYFCKFYGLTKMNFNKFSKNDLNITGKSFNSKNKFKFSNSDNGFMDSIFKHINSLKKEKFLV